MRPLGPQRIRIPADLRIRAGAEAGRSGRSAAHRLTVRHEAPIGAVTACAVGAATTPQTPGPYTA